MVTLSWPYNIFIWHMQTNLQRLKVNIIVPVQIFKASIMVVQWHPIPVVLEITSSTVHLAIMLIE